MTKDELIERLKGFEWNDVEFKEAQNECPKNVYETVSAFSNTEGGWLVFGVKQDGGSFEPVGVLEVDKVQNDFLSTLRSGQKVCKVITVKESMIPHESKTLLVFHVPEARRQDKPIYLHGDIKQSFIRRGAGDEKCRMEEIERFLRDASEERYDGEAMPIDSETFFDEDAIVWYRKQFNDRQAGGETATMSHVEFLHHWGLVVEKGDALLPTRAAVLLFGKGATLRQLLPRPVVDCQWISVNWSELMPDQRWLDRVVVEDNLIRVWRLLVQKFLEHAQRPFQLDGSTFRRDDLPPDYLGFREAAINLLIHQDYADHNRKATIQFYRDRTVLWNPGDSFASSEDLLEPVEKPIRNPRIVSAFRRIGLSEQAGTGFRTIFRAWQKLGLIPPTILNDKRQKGFSLTLGKEELLSEEQLLFQASLGIKLSDPEAKAFAVACRTGRLRLQDVKAVSGLSSKDAQGVLDRLLVEQVVSEEDSGDRTHVQLAEHLMERFVQMSAIGSSESDQPRVSTGKTGDQVRSSSDQPPDVPKGLVTDQAVLLRSLTKDQHKLLSLCDLPRPLSDLMTHFGVTHRTFFKRKHLDPLVSGGLLQLRFPDQPNHPNQAYVVTATGLELVARRMDEARKRQKE